MKKFIVLIGLTLLLPSCATVPAGDVEPPDELAKYTITEETENCLSLTRIRQSVVLNDQHILFNMRGGDVYLSKLPYRCSRLGFEEAFSYSTSLTKLCNTDIITVIDQSGAGLRLANSCGLGIFQKLEEKEAEESTDTEAELS